MVSGAPGTGKTTLAHKIGPVLGLPVLCRDGFKEVLMDALGAADVADSRRLGTASFRLLDAALGWLLDAGVGAVYESNFQRGVSEPELRVHAARARLVLLHLETSHENALARYEARARRGERHPGHHDLQRLEMARRDGVEAFDWSRHDEPLDLGVPTLRVDTTDGYAPGLEAIVAFVRDAAR